MFRWIPKRLWPLLATTAVAALAGREPGLLARLLRRASAATGVSPQSQVPPPPADPSWIAALPPGYRLLGWAALILLLPVVTAPLAGRLLRRQSNLANLLLVLTYTAVGILGAFVAHLASAKTLPGALLCLVGSLAILAYNLAACTFLARIYEP